MLIRKLQKFTVQNVSLNAAKEERRNRKIVIDSTLEKVRYSPEIDPLETYNVPYNVP